MSANVETMFYAGRNVPWHGLGTQVDKAPNSEKALELAGLNWEVNPLPVIAKRDDEDIECENWFANVRSSDNSVLGVTTGRYRIVQNKDAFQFTDALLGENVKYETAGSLAGGKRVWMLAKLPDFELVGDKAECYLAFTNSHDGKSSIKVAVTPIRVVCQNTLNLALGMAKRSWSAKHTGDMESKMAEAHRTLELAGTYIKGLKLTAEDFVKKSFTKSDMVNMAEFLFPMPDPEKDPSARIIDNVNANRGALLHFYTRADLNAFRNTKWGAINAVSDFVTHNQPQRLTANYQSNLWGSIIDGNTIIDKAHEFIKVA